MEKDLWRASVTGSIKNLVGLGTLVPTMFPVEEMISLQWTVLYWSPGMQL